LTKPAIFDRLTEIHLGDEASRRFSQLSGGQQKRLSLLIATVHDPPLVLLDEPTSGLDPQARRQLWDRIEGIRKSGRSILLTTHSMEEAQSVCDRVAIMDYGKILTVDTPAGLIEKHKNDPNVLAVARGQVTLEDVFIGLTGRELRERAKRGQDSVGLASPPRTGANRNLQSAPGGRLYRAAAQQPRAAAELRSASGPPLRALCLFCRQARNHSG